MITTLTRRVVPLLGIGALMLGFGWEQRVPSADADLWFHLRLGDEFLNGWSVRHPGHLGVFDSAEWTPTQWLTQVAMAWGSRPRRSLERGVGHRHGPGGSYCRYLRHVSQRRRPVAGDPGGSAGSLCRLARSLRPPPGLSYLFVVATLAAWLGSARDGRPRYWLVAISGVAHVPRTRRVGISISIAALAAIALERRFPP